MRCVLALLREPAVFLPVVILAVFSATSFGSLQVPSYTAPQYASPVTNAYCWISGLAIDFTNGNGTITCNVHPDAASANVLKPPIDQLQVQLGQVLVPAQGQAQAVVFPTLPQLDAAAAQAQTVNPALTPFKALRQVIYQNLALHPKLANATNVP